MDRGVFPWSSPEYVSESAKFECQGSRTEWKKQKLSKADMLEVAIVSEQEENDDHIEPGLFLKRLVQRGKKRWVVSH